MTPASLEFSAALALGYAIVLYLAMFSMAGRLLHFEATRRLLTTSSGRYGSIDGLRGVLAAGVFIHHSFAAYGYFTHGRWEWSTSAVLNQLGQSTVAVFFMITGFLFTIKAMSPVMHWRALYTSRLLRLMPLYAVVVCVVFAAVLVLSGGLLREPPLQILKEFVLWITFVCFGRPDVNGFAMTWTLIAGVNWSLKYEVMFYVLAVPLLHLAGRRLGVRLALAGSVAALGVLLLLRAMTGSEAGFTLWVVHFLGGVVVAYAYLLPGLRRTMQSLAFKLPALVFSACLLILPHAHGWLAALAGIALFAATVGGFSGFGLLKTRPALWLGDISYGIYLIHGLVLWMTLASLRDAGLLQGMGLGAYTAVMAGVSVFVVVLATLSFVHLEKPAMGWLGRPAREGTPSAVKKAA